MIRELLSSVKKSLASVSSTSSLDAELLLQHILECERSYLYTHPETLLSPSQEKDFLELIERRKTGEPIAYILGYQEFWSLRLKVTRDVLIPRPETELLVESALEFLPKNEKLLIADIGTGSGAIAIAIAKERPNWQVVATDISDAALKIARENANHHNLTNIDFIKSDLCEKLSDNTFDAIISNPPYIKISDVNLRSPTMLFEPPLALTSGADGLDAINLLIKQSKSKLKESGLLFFEHGYDQHESVLQLLIENKFSAVTSKRDLAGIERIKITKNCNSAPTFRKPLEPEMFSHFCEDADMFN